MPETSQPSGRWARALESVKEARAALERKLEKVTEDHGDMGTRAFRKTMIAAGAGATGLFTGRTKTMVKDEKTGEKKLTDRSFFGVRPGFVVFAGATLGKGKLGRFGDAADAFGDGAMAFEVGRASERAGDKWRVAAEKGNKKKKDAGEDDAPHTEAGPPAPGTTTTKGLPDGATGRGMSAANRNAVASFISAQQ